MTGAAEQRLITSGNTAGFATRASDGRTVRNGVLSLVLILLGALAVVQTLVEDDRNGDSRTLGLAAPRVLATAVVQTAVGFGLAMLVHRLAPRAGLWIVLGVVLVALYPAAMVWPRVVENPRAQVAVWAPFAALIALAAVDAIPPIVHEAAAVDRAAGSFKFRTITLPLAAPLLLLGVAFLLASGFRRLDARIVAAAYALLITAIVVGSGLARSRR
jgi:ABC-type polysaccharide transport system permease subunit